MSHHRGVAIGLLAVAIAASASVARARPLVLGTIGGAPAEQIERFAAFAADLAAPFRSDGIDSGRVVVADGVREMAELLREARVDVYVDSPLAALAVSDLAGSQMTLRCAEEEMGETHSVVFSLKTSGIGELEALPGHTMAFTSPHSTFGYLLPMLLLDSRGITVRESGGRWPAANERAVGSRFSGDDETTLVWVLRGKVEAGAVAARAYTQQSRETRERLQVLGESQALPDWIVSLRGTLPSGLASRLTERLHGMKDRDDGRRVLREGAGFDRCDLLTEPILSSILRVRAFVHAQLGIP